MTLDAIKEAIEHLPENQRRQLANWFERMEESAWDQQFDNFAAGGNGERLLSEIREEISGERAQPLGEGIAKHRAFGAVLIDAMQASPCKDLDLEPARAPLPVRDVPS